MISSEAELIAALGRGVDTMFLTEGFSLELTAPIVIESKHVHLRSDGFGATIFTSAPSRLFTVSNSAELRLEHIHMRGGTALSGDQLSGGAMHLSGGSSAVLIDSSITNCSANNGGAVHVDGGSHFLLRRSSITSCSGLGEGGAILATAQSQVQLTSDSSILDCDAGSGMTTIRPSGGAISLDGSANILTMNSSRIARCHVMNGVASGGATFADVGSLVQLFDSDVADCSSTHGGGGLHFKESFLDMVRSTVRGCTAGSENGGGLCCFRTQAARIVSSIISGCTAAQDGGGIYCEVTDITIEGTTFANCSATWGGAIQLTMVGGTSAVGDAKTLVMTDSLIERCGVYGNTRVGGGGISLLEGSMATLTRVTIVSCFAMAAAYADGGAIFSGGFGNLCEMFDCGIIRCTATGTSRARGSAAFVEQGSALRFEGGLIADCDATSPQSAQGAVFVMDVGSSVNLQSSHIKRCRADVGGALFVGQQSLAVLTSLMMEDMEAQSATVLYMSETSRLQATHVHIRHSCLDGANSSVLRLASSDSQADPKLPLRGVWLNVSHCESTTTLVEYDPATLATLHCFDNVFEDQVSRRTENICGPNTACADVTMHPLVSITTPVCSCEVPFYVAPSAMGSSQAVTPYVPAGGCVSAPRAVQALVVTDNLVFSLTKRQSASPQASRPFLLRMLGSDTRPEVRASWNITGVDFQRSGISWLWIPQLSGTIVTGSTGAWDEQVTVNVSAAGLKEQIDAYTANIYLQVTAPADRRQDTSFVVPTQLYVNAEVAGETSGWGSVDEDQRCPQQLSRDQGVVHVKLGAISELAFIACGARTAPRTSPNKNAARCAICHAARRAPVASPTAPPIAPLVALPGVSRTMLMLFTAWLRSHRHMSPWLLVALLHVIACGR